MSKEENKKPTVNQMAWILNYQPTIKEQHIHMGEKSEDCQTGDSKRVPDNDRLACAIENCQQYFWGNSAYAVLFCILRDDYKITSSKTAFEEMVEKLPYKKRRSHTCPTGTIANAFVNNPVFNENVSEWDDFTPLPRIIKLRDELRNALKL